MDYQGPLDELYLAQKERILNLEKKLLASTLQVQEQRGKFEQLEADFQHNLGVIAARDEELAAMGNKLLQLKQLCQDKQAQVKRLEERGVSVKEEARTTKDELLERLDSVRQEMRYQKKQLEDQVRSLLREIAAKDQQIEGLVGGNQELAASIERRQADAIETARRECAGQMDELRRLLQEKSEGASELVKEIEKLRSANGELEAKLGKERAVSGEAATAFQSESGAARQKIMQQQVVIEQLKKEVEEVRREFREFEEASTTRVAQISDERNALALKLQESEMVRKQKMRQIKEAAARKATDLQRECDERVRRSEYDRQLALIDFEKLSVQEQAARERVAEAEARLKREQQECEQKIQQMQRNAEQDRRQLRNDLELRDFQLKQVAEEAARLGVTVGDQNKALDQAAKRLTEVTGENKVLIEEVVKLRRMAGNKSKHQKSQGSLLDEKNARNRSKSPKQQRFLADEAEVESYEKLFSEDEGPAIQLSKHVQQHSRPMQNLSRIKYLEQENQTLKGIIDEISRDMEIAKNKLLTNSQELQLTKQESLALRERVAALQSEILGHKERAMEMQERSRSAAQLQEKVMQLQNRAAEDQAMIESLGKKVAQLRGQISDLKSEREQLLEISNELRERLKSCEDDDRRYSEQLAGLHREMESLQRQVQVREEEDKSGREEESGKAVVKDELQRLKKKFGQDEMPNLSEIQNQLWGKKRQ